MWETLGVAAASVVGTLITVYFTYLANRDKVVSVEKVNLEKMKLQIEADLWKRLQGEIERITGERDAALEMLQEMREKCHACSARE